MRAIDMHVHVPRQAGLPPMGIEDGLRKYFRVRSAPEDAADMAARYREWDIFGQRMRRHGDDTRRRLSPM